MCPASGEFAAKTRLHRPIHVGDTFANCRSSRLYSSGWSGVGARTLRDAGSDRDTLIAESLYQRLISQGETFWSVVYPLFMDREITRATVRTVVQRGLEDAGGSYQQVVRRFNMPPQDYRRFLSFLTRYELATARP